MYNWLVIADDFTGAMDAGLGFAKRGHHTVFSMLGAAGAAAGTLVLSSRSRADEPAVARAKVFDLASGSAPLARRIFKKIDSTLRGNVASELDAVFAACQTPTCVLNPAFPQQRRTVVGGRLLVDGIEVHRTQFGQDPTNPVTDSDVVTMLRRGCQLSIANVPLAQVRAGDHALAGTLAALSAQGVQVIVPDAETDGDLSMIAAAAALADLDRLVVGSAGLADHLEPARPMNLSTSIPPAAKRVVAIAGSFTQVTARQVDVAASLLGQVPYRPQLSGRGSARRALLAAGEQLASSGVWIAHPGHTRADLNSQTVARLVSWIGTLTCGLTSAGGRTGFVLTGGETAAIALEHLNASSITIAAEVQPGIPGGFIGGGMGNELPIVTKAGGFGNETAIYDAIAWLRLRET